MPITGTISESTMGGCFKSKYSISLGLENSTYTLIKRDNINKEKMLYGNQRLHLGTKYAEHGAASILTCFSACIGISKAFSQNQLIQIITNYNLLVKLSRQILSIRSGEVLLN